MNEKKLFKLIFALIVIILAIVAYIIFTKAVSVPKQNTSPVSQSLTILGETTCLPKEGTGPHTLECALGVKMLDNKYYALKNLDKHDPEHTFSRTGQQVEVTGFFEPVSKDSLYDIVGTLDVTMIKASK